jgi:acetylornithine deacetylase/succinyl-diaminopimelate desuccinylase-like protein
MFPRFSWALALLACLILAAAPELRAQEDSESSVAPPSGLAPIVAEAQNWLADLIRINTTNPPGNEMPAAQYVAAVLQKENIPSEVLEIAPGRGVVVGRLQAGPLPDASKALLLVAHLDVVGADKSRWSVDPFAAVVKNGYLYGRGAIDDKGMVAANLAVMVALKRNAVRLDRDVIFLADADEEEAGAASIKTVIDKYWDKIACAFALNEGGRVVLNSGKVQYVGLQASEKVPYDVTMIATGTSGHGSVPRADNAIVHLAAAIAKIGTFQPPVRMTAVTRTYFDQLSPVEDDSIGKWMRALETPERHDLAALRLSDMSPAWNSMLHDSITPTELQAGVGPNVVPSEARANLNVRLMPGDSVGDLVAQLQKLVNDPQIRFEIQPNAGIPAPPSSLDTPLYHLIERLVPQQFPGAVVVPLLSSGATDSAQLRLHDVQAYGLLPFPLADADASRMHGDDERIPLAAFRTGTEFLYRIVHDFVAAQ